MKLYDQKVMKEYGSSFILYHISSDIIESLKTISFSGRRYSYLPRWGWCMYSRWRMLNSTIQHHTFQSCLGMRMCPPESRPVSFFDQWTVLSPWRSQWSKAKKRASCLWLIPTYISYLTWKHFLAWGYITSSNWRGIQNLWIILFPWKATSCSRIIPYSILGMKVTRKQYSF